MPEVVREGSLRKSILFCFLAERTVWIMIRRSYHGNAMVVRNEYSKLLFLHSCVVYGDIDSIQRLGEIEYGVIRRLVVIKIPNLLYLVLVASIVRHYLDSDLRQVLDGNTSLVFLSH